MVEVVSVSPWRCANCGQILDGTAAALAAHLIDHLTNDGECDSRWTANMVVWHRCALPAVHDEPHMCQCGDTLTPAPLEP